MRQWGLGMASVEVAPQMIISCAALRPFIVTVGFDLVVSSIITPSRCTSMTTDTVGCFSSNALTVASLREYAPV